MGASKTTQTTVENKKVDPWAPAVPSLNRGLSAANSVYDQRLGQQFFPGQTFANFSPETEQGLSAMTNRAQAGSDLTRGAQGMIGSTLSGDYLSSGNPYFSAMSDRITSEVLPSITAQWARAGRGTGNNQVVEAASRGAAVLAPLAFIYAWLIIARGGHWLLGAGFVAAVFAVCRSTSMDAAWAAVLAGCVAFAVTRFTPRIALAGFFGVLMLYAAMAPAISTYVLTLDGVQNLGAQGWVGTQSRIGI